MEIVWISSFIGGLAFWFLVEKLMKRIKDPNEPIRRNAPPCRPPILSGESFREYMEQQGYNHTRRLESDIVWSETHGRYITMEELDQINQEEKIEIKPKKESIRHHFTGLPWE